MLRRCGGLVVSLLYSVSSGLGSSSGQGLCVVLLSKTLNSHSASLHPTQEYKWVPASLMLGVTLRWTSAPVEVQYKYSRLVASSRDKRRANAYSTLTFIFFSLPRSRNDIPQDQNQLLQKTSRYELSCPDTFRTYRFLFYFFCVCEKVLWIFWSMLNNNYCTHSR